MSTTTFKTPLYKELERLNHLIDAKIMHGQSYYKEARRHKELLAELRRVPRTQSRVSRYNIHKHKYAQYVLSA